MSASAPSATEKPDKYSPTNPVRFVTAASLFDGHDAGPGAEAGAHPMTQLTFTLANGFTYVEYYLARGMDIDVIAESGPENADSKP